MGLINIYNSISDEHETLHANGKLRDILPDMNFEKTMFLKAGTRMNADYEVTEDDVIYARVIPGSTVALAVISISLAVVAVGASVGASLYANKQSKAAQEEMEKAQRDAENLAAQTQQLPFIRGAKNKNALGQNIQFPMGSVYNTPYNITGGFYSIDGVDGVNSYYNATFSLGYGQQKVTEILIGNERIAYNENGIVGEHNFDEGSVYFNGDSSKVEVRGPGNSLTLANCNQKVDATYSGAELKHDYGQDAVPVIVQAADNAQKIQVCIQFSCLRMYNSDTEDWEEKTAVVRPYWSNNGGATWNEFYFEGASNNNFTKNTNQTIRYVATKEFSAAESYGKNITIKVVKENAKEKSGSQEDCALLWYQTFCYDPDKSSANQLTSCVPLMSQIINKTTRVGFRIIANTSTDNVLDELHCMTESYAKVWNGFSWSANKEPTRNPASWILEVLTTDVHKASKFTESEILMTSLGSLYEYCQTNEFYCDGIVTQATKKLDLITKILSSCNADMIINSDGLFEFVIDKEEDTPVALLNTENIKSITYAKDLSRRTDGSKVTFTNRDSWQVDTFFSMLDGGSYNAVTDIVEDFSCEFVTTYEHAYKMAQRKLRQRQLQPRTIKVNVGAEGDYYPLYSTVLLQLPQLLQGLNSSVITNITVENGNITKFTISDMVQFDSTKRYGIIIQACNNYGNNIVSVEVTGKNKTRNITLKTPISTQNSYISVGNNISFGLLDNAGRFTKITNVMKITELEPDSDNGYVLTLKDYNEEVYQYGGPIPSYKSNLTRKQKTDGAVTINDINKLRQDMNVLQEDLIRAYQVLEMPIVVDADVKSFIIEVDNDGKSASVQTIISQVTCRQGDENRNFTIGSMNLPDGWSAAVSNGRIIFTIGEGVKVSSGQFKIPVIYRPAVGYNQYYDDQEEPYYDESNEPYMEVIMSGSTYTYDIWFTYFGLGNGVYLGPFNNLEYIPSMTNLNDYFTWTGTNDTVSALSMDGVFKQARVYKFIGKNKSWEWEQDTNAGHGQAALSDVLGCANADLRNNNSTAWEYLDHLTANSIYVDMIVANQAFINQIVAKTINAGLVTTGTLDDATAYARLQAEQEAINKLGLSTQISNGSVIITGGTIIADYIAASSIKVENAKNTEQVQGYVLLGIDSQKKGYVKADYLRASDIYAKVIEANNGKFENVTVSGTINANSGTFTGRELIKGVFDMDGVFMTRKNISTISAETIASNFALFNSVSAILQFNADRAATLNAKIASDIVVGDLTYEIARGKVQINGATTIYDLVYIHHIYENGRILSDNCELMITSGMTVYVAHIEEDDAVLYQLSTNSLGTYDNGSRKKISNISSIYLRINN